MEKEQRQIIHLSELQSGLQAVLQEHYSQPFWIVAEISEISENISGHCYIDLVEKDEGSDKLLAKQRATIWAYTYRMLKPYFETSTGQPLKRGMKILVQGTVEHHPVYSLSLNIMILILPIPWGMPSAKEKKLLPAWKRRV